MRYAQFWRRADGSVGTWPQRVDVVEALRLAPDGEWELYMGRMADRPQLTVYIQATHRLVCTTEIDDPGECVVSGTKDEVMAALIVYLPMVGVLENVSEVSDRGEDDV